MRHHTHIWVLLLAALVLPPRVAAAQTPPADDGSTVRMPEAQVLGRGAKPKVVILTMQQHFDSESWPDVEARVAAELRALGLDVAALVSRAAASDERMAELGAQAAAQGALAAVRVVRRSTGRSVQVWLFDALTGKMLLREIPVPDAEATAAAIDVALQTVELLHASLIELRMPGGKRAARPVPPVIERIVNRRLALPQPRPGRWSLVAGPAVVANLGAGSPSWGLDLGVGLRLWRWLSLAASGFVPFVPGELSERDGTATLLPFIVRAGALAEPWRRARLSPALGLGIGLLIARSSGDAPASEVERVDWVAAALPYAELRLALRITSNVRIVASSTVGLALPTLPIRFAGRAIADVGRPQLSGLLAAEWTWALH